MTKYVVFSMDFDEQQTFIDYITAETPDNAAETVLTVREYCQHAQAYTLDELQAVITEALADAAAEAP